MARYGLPLKNNENENENAAQARRLQEQANAQLARNLQARYNAGLNQGVIIPQNVRQGILALARAAVNAANPNNNAEIRRARNLGAKIGAELAAKIIESKRALIAAARAATRGSRLVAEKLAEKSARLAQEIKGRVPPRSVISNYMRNIYEYAKGILNKLKTTPTALITYAKNVLARYHAVRANHGPRQTNRGGQHNNINSELNRIRITNMAKGYYVQTLNQSNKNLLLTLNDNVPEFFMVKKIVETLEHLNIYPDYRKQLLVRIPQYLRIMRYYREIDAHVSRMPMPTLQELQTYNTPRGMANMNYKINNIKTYAQGIVGTMIHYENIWQVIGEAYGFYGYAARPRISENRRAQESIDLIKSFMERLKEQIHQSALAFKAVYNRAANPIQMVSTFTERLARENFGTPCIDAGIRVLYEVSQQIQNNYPNNQRRRVQNINTWMGAQYSVNTTNGRLTNNGRTILKAILNNHATRLPQQTLSSKDLVWNSVKNKNLKVNGIVRKINSIPSAKNWVNNWYRTKNNN